MSVDAHSVPQAQRRSLRAALRSLLGDLRSVAVLALGLVRYWRSGQTPESGHHALIRLFCSTHGRVNDWLSSAISLGSRKLTIERPVGVLGDLSGTRVRPHLDKLRSDGYVVFERALSNEACDRLMQFAMETPTTVRRMDHENRAEAPRAARFDPNCLLAVRYDYDTGALLDNTDVQALLADPSLLCLAQSYLDCAPVADVLSMWWHTAYHTQPDSAAAQFFHFDMDRIKWLKIFIYLTDVGPENGPHSFVPTSHRTGGIPPEFLRRGYTRLSDEEVFGHYSNQPIRQFSAPRGSIIVEDTRGLHKGAHVSGGPRLVLQLQFSNSAFGACYPQARITAVRNQTLARTIASTPGVYKQYF